MRNCTIRVAKTKALISCAVIREECVILSGDILFAWGNFIENEIKCENHI